MALAAVAARRGVVVGGRDQSSMGRDDAAPAPGLGLAGPASTGFERRQELAVEVVVAAGRRRPVIRVGTVDERVVFMRPRGVAERGHAARRKAPLALRRRKAGGEASHSAFSVFYRKGLSGYAAVRYAKKSSVGWRMRSVDVT